MPKILKAENIQTDAIGSNGNTNFDLQRNSSTLIRLNTSENVGIGTTLPSSKLTIESGASVDLKVQTTSQTINTGPSLTMALRNGSGNLFNGATLSAKHLSTNQTASAENAYLSISIVGNGTLSERFRIGPVGQFGIGGANYGSFGQFLISNGSSNAPQWDGTLTIDNAANVTLNSGGVFGYGTGSGGTITQSTGRTSGVTLNKTNGSITLVSAAGTTTWQSFVVTNNKVSANDIIIVNQKSGTDLYEIQVTNVSNSSFTLSFRTTGGTTTEQPVFNFAIIRGSIA